MSTNELLNACNQQIQLCGDNADVAIKMRGKWGKTDYRKLLGVKGEIVLETVQNNQNILVVMFPAKELKDAILKECGVDLIE